MCKILVLTNMSKIKKSKKTIDCIAHHLQQSERDGFGYTIQGKHGLYGERTTKKSFLTSFDMPLVDLPFLKARYNRFGKYSAPIGAGIFHGRTSTNDKTLLNTHPIQKHDWTLIHNGVVSNHGDKYEMVTTNDTEHLVHYLATKSFDELTTNLSGYYAVAAFDPAGGLHVFRDNRAMLYWARIESIDSDIIATTETLIEDVCKDMGWKHSVIAEFNENTYVVMKSGEYVDVRTFQPRGATAIETAYSEKSLGRAWSHEEYNVVDASMSKYSSGELNFFEEVAYMDRGYTVLDYRENPISIDEFHAMDEDEQLSCIVIRPDGTVIDVENPDSERLYSGRIA
jgi:predicted glutamine amidotransferase